MFTNFKFKILNCFFRMIILNIIRSNEIVQIIGILTPGWIWMYMYHKLQTIRRYVISGFRLIKRNIYIKIYVKVLTVSKKLKKLHFQESNFLKFLGQIFCNWSKKINYCYNIIQMHIILHIYQPIETILNYNRNHGRFYET